MTSVMDLLKEVTKLLYQQSADFVYGAEIKMIILNFAPYIMILTIRTAQE